MPLNAPTLLLTADAAVAQGLTERIDRGSDYLIHAPHWDAFDRLCAQLVFGVIVVDADLLSGPEGSLSSERLEQLIEEALDASGQARLVVFNVPDGPTLERLAKAGIHEMILAPLALEQLALRVEREGETYNWLAQRHYYRGQSGHIFRIEDIIGESPAMIRVFEQVRRVASARSPVLITGETGTGKELIAAAIHYNSPRRDGAFIKVNCAALQDTLLESDLFGHEKGAFTGAVRQRLGRFEQAHGGTLFLDEIGDMSPAIQAKVLRVLQSQEFERVGGTRVIRVNVRLIAATNQVLEQAMRAGSFREDLYYRLKVVTVHLPPLRERTSDIPLLARFFLKKARFEEKRPARDFEPDALEYLQEYPWPGNVRELENTVLQAVLLSESERIRRRDLALYLRPGEEETSASLPPFVYAGEGPVVPTPAPVEKTPSRPPAASPAPPGLDLGERERQTILEALEASAWVQSRAARSLGISPRALNYRIVKHGITHPSWRVHRPGESSD